MKKCLLGFLLSVTVFLSGATSIFAGRGCCSWHGGVSHCDTRTGRQVCNDGTYSPSCGCYRAPAAVVTKKPTPTPTTYRYPTPYQSAYTSTTDNSDNIVWIFLAGVLACASLVLGWITNLINRPNSQDKKLVKEIIKATEEVYSKNRSRMVTSPEYLTWENRSDEVDDMVCANMGITSYQYSSLIKRKSVRLLYKRMVNARERANSKKDGTWYERLTSPLFGIVDWITQKADENIFYAVVFYPLTLVIGFGVMIAVMIGFSIFQMVVFSPLIVIFMYEIIGWPLVILYYVLLIVGYLWWTNREKK